MKKETVKQAKIIPSEDLAVFCDEIAVMLRAGISLPDGMALIAGHSVPTAEKMLLDMQKQMENGSSFSSAMAETGVFPEELTEMAAIGENAGVLEQVMDEMSAHYRRESTVKRQVRNAVLCPVATLVLMAAVLGVLNAKVFPVFTGIFSGLGKEMSDAAATAVSLGGFFAKAAALAAVLTVVCCLTVWVLGTTEKGRKIRQTAVSELPLLRTASAKISASRFCSCLSMLLAGGYSAEGALERIGTILPDPSVRKKAELCREQLASGADLGDALANTGLFQGLQNGLIAVSVQSGTLDETLRRIAEQELDAFSRILDRAVALLEPATVGLTAVMIGSVLLSVMLPLSGMLTSIG